MRLDNFDLNLLVAFEVLLEERSVTRAAKRLNLTQSAMSAALKRLRESFQDEVLVLHNKQMIPTQHALALAPQISSTLLQLKSLIAAGTGFDPATSKRQFFINASDYVTTVVLAPLVTKLQDEAPGVRIEFSLPGASSAARLENGDIDLIVTPEEFMEGDHPREFLFEERHVVVGARENPVFKAPLTLDTYLECGHVAVRIAGRDTFVEGLLKRDVPNRRIEVAAQSFIQVPWLLTGSRRLGMMHERLAKASEPVFDLAIAEPPFDLPVMREMMQYHGARENDAGLVWLRERILEIARTQ